MKLYKLTTKNNGTYNNTWWGPGVTHSGTGKGKLCSEGYIHAYLSPELAVLLNPIHNRFVSPKLWEAEGDVALWDCQLKVGCVSLTTIKEISIPSFTIEQKIYFSIICALHVYKEKSFVDWANDWISGKDRKSIVNNDYNSLSGTIAAIAAHAAHAAHGIQFHAVQYHNSYSDYVMTEICVASYASYASYIDNNIPLIEYALKASQFQA